MAKRREATWIDIKTLAYRWDTTRRTAARVARINNMKIMKLGRARNSSVKVKMEDVLKYERK